MIILFVVRFLIILEESILLRCELMTINIATIGSFITNDNFNSAFNPYYKQFFNVVVQENQVPIINSKVSRVFFKKLTENQPQYLLLDFSLDICHGWMPLKKRRLPFQKTNQHKVPWDNYQNFDGYFDMWKNAVQHLINFLKNEIPDCQIVLVQGYFADTFTDGSSVTTYCEKNGISLIDIEKMNQQWEMLNRYFLEQYNVEILDLTSTNYHLDKTCMTTKCDFHFENKYYNQFLNQFISMSYQHPIVNIKNVQTTQRIYLDEDYDLLGTKQVDVVLDSDLNLIILARKDQKKRGPAYQLYKKLLKHDYILYAHEDGISKLYQRRYVNEFLNHNDWNRVGDVYYTLDAPKRRKGHKTKTDKKLIVIFPCMPSAKKYDHHVFTDRMFVKLFKKIESFLTENVYIMRIMDLNVSHGSYFINTVNNQTLEEDISNAIIEVRDQLNLQNKDIVLYGTSKGGTGALYYGAKLDLKCLAADPIIHLGEYNKNDTHFLRDMRKEEISEDINDYLRQGSNYKKYIIASENVAFNFKYSSKIIGKNVIKLNKKDERIQKHTEVLRQTKFEQLMLLNHMLLDKNWIKSVFHLRGLRKKLVYVWGLANAYKSLKVFK